MIELLQQIVGVVLMFAESIVNGISAIGSLLPLTYEIINYIPAILMFPCSLIVSYASVRFVLSLF